MANIEPTVYQRVSENPTKQKNLIVRPDRKDFLSACMGFFLAMSMPYPNISPFGLSFLAGERRLSLRAFIIFIATSLGSMAACDRVGAAKYIGAGVIYMAVLFVLERGISIRETYAAGIIGMSLFVSGLAALYWQTFTFEGILLLLCEGVCAATGVLVMEKSKILLTNKKSRIQSADSEEKLSLAATVILLLMSLRDIYIGSEFSVMNLAAITVVLTVAYSCGLSYSTGCGIILGLVSGIGTDFFLPILGALGFCGFLSGLFSKFGKGGVICGAVIANAVLVVYTNGAMISMLSIYEILVSAVIFAFIPKKTSNFVRDFLALGEREKESIVRVRENIKSRLTAIASSFDAMANTLEKLSDKEKTGNSSDIATLDMAADKICRNCRKSPICWGKEFNSTYKSMFALLEIMESKGSIEESDVSDYFRARCLNLPKLLGEIGTQYDVYQMKRVWQSKLMESRELVGEQLFGVSRIIDNLADEIDGENIENVITVGDIRANLEEKGVRIRDVNICEDRNKKYKAEITLKRSALKKDTLKTVRNTMRSLMGGNIRMTDKSVVGSRLVTLEFCEEERFTVETGHAVASASEKSGDNFRMSYLSCGKYVITISDGMGTGSRAARESAAIIELLDSFIRAGFDSLVAVKLINSLMIMKSENEAFVTIDMCIIDLYTGETEFIKTGAQPSFIMKKSGIERVSSSSLPVGIIPGAEAEILDRFLDNGDTIIMMTDGVESKGNGDDWIKSFIAKNKADGGMKSLSDKILENAIRENGGKVNDDITVISVRLKEKNAA